MHDVKELDMTYHDEVIDIWLNSGIISGTVRREEFSNAFVASVEYYLSRKTPSRLIGAISKSNGELKSFLSMDKIYGWPYYSQGWLTTRKSNYFSPIRNGSSQCFALMEKIGEENGWYKYFLHQSENKWQNWRHKHDPEFRYTVCIEERIPAGSIPSNSAFWPMMGYQTWDIPTLVKSVSLKPEFRPLQF